MATRIVWNNKAFRRILRGEATQNELKTRAHAISDTLPDGYKAMASRRRTRPRYIVYTATDTAKRDPNRIITALTQARA